MKLKINALAENEVSSQNKISARFTTTRQDLIENGSDNLDLGATTWRKKYVR